jgi:hypothetical protein
MRRGAARNEASVFGGTGGVAKGVLTWVGLLLGVGGIIAFIYGLTILVSNGSCGCDQNGFCSGPQCPPADDLGFVGLFAGIWVAVGGFILMGVARGHARAQQWRAQFASETGAFANMSHAYATTGAPGLTLGSMSSGSIASGQVAMAIGGSTIVSRGPGFALPGASTPAPESAEAILARDAQAGLPGVQPAPGDAAGRLQELEALKQQGVLNDDEYAAQRKRILDSI